MTSAHLDSCNGGQSRARSSSCSPSSSAAGASSTGNSGIARASIIDTIAACTCSNSGSPPGTVTSTKCHHALFAKCSGVARPAKSFATSTAVWSFAFGSGVGPRPMRISLTASRYVSPDRDTTSHPQVTACANNNNSSKYIHTHRSRKTQQFRRQRRTWSGVLPSLWRLQSAAASAAPSAPRVDASRGMVSLESPVSPPLHRRRWWKTRLW